MSGETPAVREALPVYEVEAPEIERVPPGYKHTEVGVIPEDWETRTFAELCTKIQDGTHFSPRLDGSDFLYVTSKNIRFGTFEVSNAERIDAVQHQKIYQRCDIKKGDLLLTKDGANTGNAAINHLAEEFSLLSSVAFLRFDPKLHDAGFYLQFILSSAGQQTIKDLMSGNAITRLTLEKIRKITVPSPPLSEQRAIATALSDVDDLISALDHLIAKKRAIKTAAMQQLLTGKQRLPGFSGEWETRRLGDVFSFLSTANNPRSDLSEHGDIGYVHYGDLHATDLSFLDCSRSKVPHIARDKVKDIFLLKEGDLIMVDASEDYEGIGKSVEVKNLNGRELVAGLHTFLLRGDKELLANGFKGYLQYIPRLKSALVRLATGISVYGISKNSVRSIEISLPGIEEQTAVAAVLSDMDAETAALEARREKTRQVKQGMMQELLTGRTRLV